jgi:hypothetical protein
MVGVVARVPSKPSIDDVPVETNLCDIIACGLFDWVLAGTQIEVHPHCMTHFFCTRNHELVCPFSEHAA